MPTCMTTTPPTTPAASSSSRSPPSASPGSGATNDTTTNVRVYNNTVTANNGPNFADPSGSVAQVPSGSGIIVLAAKNVEVFNNTVSNNDTLAVMNASYLVLNPSFNPTDPAQNPTGLNPFSDNIYVHDNTFSNNGGSPRGRTCTRRMAAPADSTNSARFSSTFRFSAPGRPHQTLSGTASRRLPYVPPAVNAGDARLASQPVELLLWQQPQRECGRE